MASPPLVRRLRLLVAVGLACSMTSLAGCSVPARTTCTAGRFDAFMVGPQSTPYQALQGFLHSLDAAGMPTSGWTETERTATVAVFRNGSNRVNAVLSPDGWEVTSYTTCAT